MSDMSQGPGWWQASDDRWYAPERHPDYVPPITAASVASSPMPEAPGLTADGPVSSPITVLGS